MPPLTFQGSREAASNRAIVSSTHLPRGTECYSGPGNLSSTGVTPSGFSETVKFLLREQGALLGQIEQERSNTTCGKWDLRCIRSHFGIGMRLISQSFESKV